MTNPSSSLIRAAGRLIVAAALAAVLPQPVEAQRTWLGPTFDRSVGLEITKPFFRGEGTTVVLGAALARVPVGPSTALTFELPVSMVRIRATEFPRRPAENAFTIGNPWIGVEYRGGGEVLVQAGIRPGIYKYDRYDRNNDVGYQAFYAAFVGDLDHFEAWLPQVSTGRVEVQIGRLPSKGLAVTGRVGGTLLYNISSDGGDPEVYGDYGLRAGWWGEKVAASVAAIGRAIVTTPGGSFADRTEHRLGGRVEWLSGPIRPWVEVRTPLDDYTRQVARVTGVVGLSAAF